MAAPASKLDSARGEAEQDLRAPLGRGGLVERALQVGRDGVGRAAAPASAPRR